MTTYFDLDGVLNDFEDWSLSLNPKTFRNTYEMTTTLLQNYRDAFFTSRPYEKGLKVLEVKRSQNPKILTSLPYREDFQKYYPYLWESYKESGTMLDIDYIFETFRENKRKWCENYLQIPRERVIIVESNEAKWEWCREGDVLYDDNPYTIAGWNERGGIGVLLKFGKETWRKRQ